MFILFDIERNVSRVNKQVHYLKHMYWKNCKDVIFL